MSGYLHVITGPMFSGKTEVLLSLVRKYDIKQKKVKLFSPAIDDRTDLVTSRAGTSLPAIKVFKSYQIVTEHDAVHQDVIIVDEAQFFDNELADMLNDLADLGLIVIASGLDRDFLRRPFGPMEKLLVYADRVDKLTAVCTKCHEDATLTQRLVNGRPATRKDPIILVGGMGDDSYEARCREHHEIGYVDVL